MSHTMKFLLSSEAAEARVSRLGRQIQWRGRLVRVVHVEIHGALGSNPMGLSRWHTERSKIYS